MFYKSVVVLFGFLFVSQLSGYDRDSNISNRYPLQVEYRLVNACIDHNSFGGISKRLRDKCIKRVLFVEREHSFSDIKQMDSKGALEKLFDLK